MRCLIVIICCLFNLSQLEAQAPKIKINGEILPYMIDECGDTLILAQLGDVTVSSLRQFENKEDYIKYRRYKRYAAKVYPYAVEAIKVFRNYEYATEGMKRRKHERKYARKLQKELKEEFKLPLKKLTKTQGMILMKMIEKELDITIYELIKDLRGGLNATYWGTMAGMFGHKLKEGYQAGDDPILDAVLNDLDVSYEMSGGR